MTGGGVTVEAGDLHGRSNPLAGNASASSRQIFTAPQQNAPNEKLAVPSATRLSVALRSLHKAL